MGIYLFLNHVQLRTKLENQKTKTFTRVNYLTSFNYKMR